MRQSGAQVGRELRIAGRIVRLLEGDIARLDRQVDLLVSSDDNYLSHGGGVSYAIWSAGGPAVAKVLETVDLPLALGDVVVGPAGALAAGNLMHAVTLELRSGAAVNANGATRLYRSVFEHALRAGATRVALPLLGTGVAGLSVEASGRALVRGLDQIDFLGGALTEVVVVVFGQNRAAELETTFATVDGQLSLPEIVASFGEPVDLLDHVGTEPIKGMRLLESALDAVASGLELRFDANSSLGSRVHHLADRVPGHVRVALELAVLYRNNVVHGRGEADAHPLLDAVRELGRWFLPTRSATRPAAPATPATTHAKKQPTKPSKQAPLGVELDAETSAVDGTAHVRRLHAFLLGRLSYEARSELASHLRGEGYVGSDEACLLEFCVRMDDPVGFLASEFAARDLRTWVHETTGERLSMHADSREAAAALLAAFGFPKTSRLIGLRWVGERLVHLRSEVHTSDTATVRGLVQDASSWLEHLVVIQIRFTCEVLFEQPAEILLREHGWLEKSYTLSKCSLGKLLDLLAKLADHLAKNDNDRLRYLRAQLDGVRIAPPGAQELTALRNKLAHAAELGEELELDEARRLARKFFEGADAYVALLREGKFFPAMVRIESVTIDRWSRRLIRATAEDGSTEYLFHDWPVTPGESYLMLAVTNPLRVDPFLVATSQTTKGS
jgi:O-acetyl-ADP-ribose deacetylase (regulator of RNase III)